MAFLDIDEIFLEITLKKNCYNFTSKTISLVKFNILLKLPKYKLYKATLYSVIYYIGSNMIGGNNTIMVFASYFVVGTTEKKDSHNYH